MDEVSISDEWRRLVDKLREQGLNANYHPPRILHGQPYPRVTVEGAKWHLSLDGAAYKGGLHSTTWSGPYTGKNPFKFFIRSGAWFNHFDRAFIKLAGRTPIEEDFDKRVWVKSTNEALIKSVLNDDVRPKILTLETCLVGMDHQQESYELSFADTGVDITVDVERLQMMLDLMVSLMDGMDSDLA
jgi:hypothetical protein